MSSPLSLLGNGLIYTFPRKRIHETNKNYWTRRFLCGSCRIKGESVGLCIPLSLRGKGSENTFPLQRRIVGIVFFCALYVASKESRRLISPRTSCYWFLRNITKPFQLQSLKWDEMIMTDEYVKVSKAIVICLKAFFQHSLEKRKRWKVSLSFIRQKDTCSLDMRNDWSWILRIWVPTNFPIISYIVIGFTGWIILASMPPLDITVIWKYCFVVKPYYKQELIQALNTPSWIRLPQKNVTFPYNTNFNHYHAKPVSWRYL
jgi:hypothetical protein